MLLMDIRAVTAEKIEVRSAKMRLKSVKKVVSVSKLRNMSYFIIFLQSPGQRY